jgi:hypothetical protein
LIACLRDLPPPARSAKRIARRERFDEGWSRFGKNRS